MLIAGIPSLLICSHMDDMTSLAFCSPNILATSSVDGKIALWNLESGSIKMTLQDPFLDIRSKEEKSVEKVKRAFGNMQVLFLTHEEKEFTNATGLGVWPQVPLVSCHSDGNLRFWDIPGGNLVLEVIPIVLLTSRFVVKGTMTRVCPT